MLRPEWATGWVGIETTCGVIRDGVCVREHRAATGSVTGKNSRVFVLGGRPGVVERAMRKVPRRTLQVVAGPIRIATVRPPL